ncbi:hypothetical protein [Leptospira andrefontaineae]|uniref:Uncharacterized protein n=1 Tax=Leptospira andrefontaineae TaxID=2484976 RepID=A0A4R9HAI5_9LEPT|nr:hypothetical protein [Leptospira andrefontaineae]TGK43540.1 hypothetical protein EHO65_02555 [Leptospira andrefontaineae]
MIRSINTHRAINSVCRIHYVFVLFVFVFAVFILENRFKKKPEMGSSFTSVASWETTENFHIGSEFSPASSSESVSYSNVPNDLFSLGFEPLEKEDFELEVYLDRIQYFYNLSQIHEFYFAVSTSYADGNRSKSQDYSEKRKDEPVANFPTWRLLSKISFNFSFSNREQNRFGLSCFSHTFLGFEDQIGFCYPKYSQIALTKNKKLSRYLARLHHSDPEEIA